MSDRASTSVKVGSVSLTVSPHTKGWRYGFKGESGKWEYITRKNKKDAIDSARAKAKELHNGAAETSLTADEAILWKRVLRLKVTHADLDALEAARGQGIVMLDAAVDEMMALKKANRGRSERNVRSLSSDLGSLKRFFGAAPLRSITVQNLEEWIASHKDVGPRRRRNLRGACVTFFRWARARQYVADGTTAAERIERPIVPKVPPITWSAEEMATLLKNCPQDYVPWLVLAGFAHFRSSELFERKGRKSALKKIPLDWSDIDFDEDVIRVKPATAKGERPRITPVIPIVKAWLLPHRKASGPVCPKLEPGQHPKKGEALTVKLGALVGGWKVNALRHSSISYRAVEIGLAKTAMEAGNSESEARKSYNNAKTKKEAEAWYELTPEKVLRS